MRVTDFCVERAAQQEILAIDDERSRDDSFTAALASFLGVFSGPQEHQIFKTVQRHHFARHDQPLRVSRAAKGREETGPSSV